MLVYSLIDKSTVPLFQHSSTALFLLDVCITIQALWCCIFLFLFMHLLATKFWKQMLIMNMLILCCFMQALHEALMRQEELLAYIDSQEEAKFRVG